MKTCLLLALSLLTVPAWAAEKLVALTFDDGPRPYVLFGTKTPSTPGLLDVLDQNGVKATFFVMGWRLTAGTHGDRRETDIGMSCRDAATQVLRRGHEIENHTFSHVELGTAEKRKGEAWVIGDVEHGAQVVRALTGAQPKYLRPPDWVLPEDARRDLEGRGYRILTISTKNPPALRDVNSQDYLCAGAHPAHCPQPSLIAAVLKQVEQREKAGVYTHVLAFHELSTTTAIVPELIRQLKARGYRFVRLDEYMRLADPASNGAGK